MEYNSINIIIASTLLGIGSGSPSNAVALKTPKLVRMLLGGKFTNVQVAFFSVEGHLNAATIHWTLFGGAFGRMTWSINRSPLHRSRINKHGESIGCSEPPELGWASNGRIYLFVLPLSPLSTLSRNSDVSPHET
ncbi:hypothetical protein SCUP234_12070 [Seiridium cupressi]